MKRSCDHMYAYARILNQVTQLWTQCSLASCCQLTNLEALEERISVRSFEECVLFPYMKRVLDLYSSHNIAFACRYSMKLQVSFRCESQMNCLLKDILKNKMHCHHFLCYIKTNHPPCRLTREMPQAPFPPLPPSQAPRP